MKWIIWRLTLLKGYMITEHSKEQLFSHVIFKIELKRSFTHNPNAFQLESKTKNSNRWYISPRLWAKFMSADTHKKNTYSIVCAKGFLSLQTYTYHHCFWRIQMVRRDRSPFVKPHTTRSPCWALYLLTWLQNEVLCITRLCAESKFWNDQSFFLSCLVHTPAICKKYSNSIFSTFWDFCT